MDFIDNKVSARLGGSSFLKAMINSINSRK